MDAPKEQHGDGAGQYDGTGGFLHGGDSDAQVAPPVNPISFGQATQRHTTLNYVVLTSVPFQLNQDIARIDPRVFGGRIDQGPKKDEFLFNQGAGSANRHWGEKLTYSLGVSYLAGAVARSTREHERDSPSSRYC